MHDESALEDFTENLIKFIESVCPTPVPAQEGFTAIAKDLHKKTLHNIRVRKQLIDLLTHLTSVNELPAGACEAVDEWKTVQGSGKNEASFFSKARMAQQASAKLAGLSFDLGQLDPDVDFIIELDEGEGLERYHGSVTKTATFVQTVLGLPVLDQMRQLLTCGVQLTVDEFAMSLRLNFIRKVNLKANPHTPEAAMEMVSELIEANVLPQVVKHAAKVFAPTSKKNVMWSCDVLLALLKELSTVVPVECLSVSMVQLRSEGDLVWTSPENILSVIELWMSMSQVATSLVYVASRSSNQADLVRDSRLKHDISRPQ